MHAIAILAVIPGQAVKTGIINLCENYLAGIYLNSKTANSTRYPLEDS